METEAHRESSESLTEDEKDILTTLKHGGLIHKTERKEKMKSTEKTVIQFSLWDQHRRKVQEIDSDTFAKLEDNKYIVDWEKNVRRHLHSRRHTVVDIYVITDAGVKKVTSDEEGSCDRSSSINAAMKVGGQRMRYGLAAI